MNESISCDGKSADADLWTKVHMMEVYSFTATEIKAFTFLHTSVIKRLPTEG